MRREWFFVVLEGLVTEELRLCDERSEESSAVELAEKLAKESPTKQFFVGKVTRAFTAPTFDLKDPSDIPF